MKNFFSISPIEYFTRTQIDAVKGVLILSVMIGHLRSLAGVNLEIFQFVYNYHVIGFLLLPFLYPIKLVTSQQIITWIWRFFVPFTVFFILYGTLNLLFLNANFSFLDIVKGYFIATPSMVDVVTGSEILWFLPHIFLVFLLFNLIMTKSSSIFLVFVISLVFHALIGFLDDEYASYIPFTASNILYLFFIGFVLRFIVMYLREDGKKYIILFLFLFLVTQFISIYTKNVLGYTGLYLFDASSPLKLILCDVLVISGMLSFVYLGFLPKVKFINWLGQHSIIVFLVHQPFLFLTWKTLEMFSGGVQNIYEISVYGFISLLISLIFSSLLVLFFMRYKRINTLIFPRDYQSWIQAIKMKANA